MILPLLPLWAPLANSSFEPDAPLRAEFVSLRTALESSAPVATPSDSFVAGIELALITGGFTVLDDDTFLEAGLEVRFPPASWELIPIAGITAIEGGASYTYAGLRYELDLGPHFYLAPSFAAGLYDASGTFDLGGPIEFRSAIELGWHASDWLDVGLTFYHLSNARLYESNHGSESLVLSLGVDLLRLF